MLNAPVNSTIVFDTVSMCGAADGNGACTITLNGPLPPLNEGLTIEGGDFLGGSPRITIDGNSAYRAFFVTSGVVNFNNLQIANTLAQGGAGAYGTGGGGGGAGLGSGLFETNGQVYLTNVFFTHCSAVGGAGGGSQSSGVGSGGGGGGLAGAGSGNFGAGNPQSMPGGGGGGAPRRRVGTETSASLETVDSAAAAAADM